MPQKGNNYFSYLNIYKIPAIRKGDQGEGVLVRVISKAELPVFIIPTGIHLTVLTHDHRMGTTSNNLRSFRFVRKGDLGEGSFGLVIA